MILLCKFGLNVWRERVKSSVWVKACGGCICGLYTFLLMRILTKRSTANLRVFLKSTHFFFCLSQNFFSRILTIDKRPTAIIRPFLESKVLVMLKKNRKKILPLIHWKKYFVKFLPHISGKEKKCQNKTVKMVVIVVVFIFFYALQYATKQIHNYRKHLFSHKVKVIPGLAVAIWNPGPDPDSGRLNPGDSDSPEQQQHIYTNFFLVMIVILL